MKCNRKNRANQSIIKILILKIAVYIIPSLTFFILLTSNLYALTPVIIDDNTESVSPGKYMEILEDPSGELTINDVTKPEMSNRWFQSECGIAELNRCIIF